MNEVRRDKETTHSNGAECSFQSLFSYLAMSLKSIEIYVNFCHVCVYKYKINKAIANEACMVHVCARCKIRRKLLLKFFIEKFERHCNK